MLDIPPGTQVLNGVRDTLALLYPPDPERVMRLR